ncbi:TM2 domain-containing protein [Limimaricola sp.]|uniref:TM2 domain-containing protein n=1 Tax=Limimaricola sp. TaxID=2211665 RepID=UPI004058556B
MPEIPEQPDTPPAGTKNLSTAMLLALFLGPFGAHRFYLGRKGSAAMMLMLAVTIVGLLVTLVWLIIDLPRIPAMIRRHNTLLDRRRDIEDRSRSHGFPMLS